MSALSTLRPRVATQSRRWLPSQCEVCRDWSAGLVCPCCMERFAAPRPRCRQCGLALALASERCGDCLRDPPPFERTFCAADYGFPWDALAADFKFNGRAELASPLVELMWRARADTGATVGDPHGDADAVLPVPLAPARLAARGYDQAWELARRLAARLGLPAHARALRRIVETGPQAELTRERRLGNLRGAFAVPPDARALVAGRHLLLVDDVMTTGTTLREAAATLRRAGATRVDVWVLARTPADGRD